MAVVITGSMITVAMGTEEAKRPIGRDTIGGGVAVEVPAAAKPLMSKEAATASVTPFQLVQLILVFLRMQVSFSAKFHAKPSRDGSEKRLYLPGIPWMEIALSGVPA